jgi:hypothetical protein
MRSPVKTGSSITGLAGGVSGLEAQPVKRAENTVKTMTWLQYERIEAIMAGGLNKITKG